MRTLASLLLLSSLLFTGACTEDPESDGPGTLQKAERVSDMMMALEPSGDRDVLHADDVAVDSMGLPPRPIRPSHDGTDPARQARARYDMLKKAGLLK